MKKIKKLVAACMLAISLTSFVACGNTLSKNTVLATVGQEEIRLETVDKSLFAFIEEQKKLHGENFESKMDEQAHETFLMERQNVLTQLIIEKILLKKADEFKLIPSDEELNTLIDKEIEESIKTSYGSAEVLEKAKKMHGYTDESFREFVKNNIIQNLVVEHVTKDISASDEEIQKFYNEYKDTFTIKAGGDVKHLLFKEDSDEKSKAAAEEAYGKLVSSEKTFDQMFKEFSENKLTNTYPISEDLNYVPYEDDTFDKDFLAGMKGLKNKEFSKPIKSAFGYHIIYIDNIKNVDTQLALDEVKDHIKNQLEYEPKYKLYTEKLSEWGKELNVQDLSEDILSPKTPDKTESPDTTEAPDTTE